MYMEDYLDLEKEYKDIEKSSKIHVQNLKYIFDKINVFHTSMKDLKERITSIPNLSNSPFGFLDESFRNFIKLLEQNSISLKSLILKPITNLMNCIKEGVNDNLKRLSEIKMDLSDEKMNLLIKKDTFFGLNKTNNNKKHKKSKTNILFEKDEKIYNDAVKENNNQLYKYELNKMNEVIDENNKKYNNLHIELNSLNANSIIIVKDSLMHFATYIKNLGEMLNLLSFEIMNKMESSKNFDNKGILQILDKKNKQNEIRFKKETVELDNKVDIKFNNNEISGNFVILDNIVYEDNFEKDKYIDDKINLLLANNEEIKSKEISNLLNILKIKDNKDDINYSIIFLNKISILCKKEIIFIKNRHNFSHLSNIINDLFLNDKENMELFNLIIEISRMICYKNIFLYKAIREKNKYLNTKTLWNKLISMELFKKLKNNINNMLNKKEEKDKKNKNNNNDAENIEEKSKIKELENLKIALKKLEIYYELKDYKKLKTNQLLELNAYSKKMIIEILSNVIPSMCNFGVNNSIIEDILKLHAKYFFFSNEEIIYLKNKEIIKNIKTYKQPFAKKEDLILSRNIMIISLASKYLSLNEIPNLLKLSKNIYKKLKNKIFLNIFSNSNLHLNKNIKFWNKYLKIDDIKTTFLYEDIKSGINCSIFQGQITKGTKQLKNMEVIEQDLRRTYFLVQNPIHYNSFKSILNIFLITFPQIGYCQGMNSLVSFLYQLLGQDEEKTFNYLCGLELNTKYHEIFEDDFITLKIFFDVFDKLLKLLRPDVYYKFKKYYILPNCYCSAWFITLFTQYIKIIDEKNPPLLLIFIFNKFIVGGWNDIFNFGLMLIDYSYEKIMELKNEKLVNYVMNVIEIENIFDDNCYKKCKDIFLKDENIVNDEFIKILLDISKFEYYQNSK